MSRSLRHIAAAFLLAFAGLAVLLGWWSIGAPGLSARDDNPRLVFDELRIQRGPIVDRYDRVLAQSVITGGLYERRYPITDTAPAVGYYSLNYGVSGIEETFDQSLRGHRSEIDQLLHRPQSGRGVRLTLDATVQRDLAARLTQPGALIVLSLPDSAVLALESHPAYDPNTLNADWKTLSTDPAAPLLNRATAGLYQPGAILQTIWLAEMLDRGETTLTQTLTRPDQPVALNGLVLTCGTSAATIQTLADAYAHSCPAPFAEAGVNWGEEVLISTTQKWGLVTPPPLEIRSAAVPTLTRSLSTTEALQAFAAGQGELTVTPLHLALVAATIANDGYLPVPHLVQDVQDADGKWTTYTGTLAHASQRIISADAARAVLATMPQFDGVAGHGGAAYSGAKQLSWFIGLAPAQQPRYAIAVLIETPQGTAATEAAAIGRAALKALAGQP